MIKRHKYLIVYLVFFVALPFLITILPIDKDNKSVALAYLGAYVIFISPILFIIPYKFSRLASRKEKFYFIFFGFILPFALVYYYLYLDFQKNFHPGF